MYCNQPNVHNASKRIQQAIALIRIDGQPLPTADYIKLKTVLFLLEDAALLLDRMDKDQSLAPHESI